MKTFDWFLRSVLLSALSGALVACGSAGGPDAELPPRGEAAIDAWIAEGTYKSWHCEAERHAPRAPSMHQYNRACSNDLLSGNPDHRVYPKGAASVKEFWGPNGDGIVGYAVYLKVQDDSADGKGWYYYAKIPAVVPDGPVVDGTGDTGKANQVCVPCHKAAGTDAMHFGNDFVYTQVK